MAAATCFLIPSVEDPHLASVDEVVGAHLPGTFGKVHLIFPLSIVLPFERAGLILGVDAGGAEHIPKLVHVVHHKVVWSVKVQPFHLHSHVCFPSRSDHTSHDSWSHFNVYVFAKSV